METLRQQILGEVEKPFRERLVEIDAELEKSQSDYKKLKYDHAFLRSEYQHEIAEHKRIVSELTLRYEAEVSSIGIQRPTENSFVRIIRLNRMREIPSVATDVPVCLLVCLLRALSFKNGWTDRDDVWV